MKRNRDYVLRVRDRSREIRVVPDIRLSFECTKTISGSGLHKLTGLLYGLGQTNRQTFVKDAEENKLVTLDLSVGYQGRLVQVFTGQLHRGSNALTSNGYNTKFEVYDGGFDFISAFTNKSVPAGADTVTELVADMANTLMGKVTNIPAPTRPKVLFGSTSELLQDAAGANKFFISEGRVNILADGEVLSSHVPLIAASTGLVSTPEREFSKVTFDTLMNPYLTPGGLCDLESSVDRRLNGIYRIDTITYKGDTEGKDWNQRVTAFLQPNFKVL